MYHHISRFSISVGMVIGEYRGYVVMIAGQTSRFRGVSWILTIRFFSPHSVPHIWGISVFSSQKKHWFESTHGNGSFQWKFHYVTMETGPVGQIMAENPVVFQFLLLHCCTSDIADLAWKSSMGGLKTLESRQTNHRSWGEQTYVE